MRHSSYWTVDTNARVVYWLNVGDLESLSHNISYAVSSIPGLNKYFFLLTRLVLITNLFKLLRLWTSFKYHQDLSCEYIKMKFRIYLSDSNISCIYSAIKFRIYLSDSSISCSYSAIKFRIYLSDSNISCIYSAIKFQIWLAYIFRLNGLNKKAQNKTETI